MKHCFCLFLASLQNKTQNRPFCLRQHDCLGRGLPDVAENVCCGIVPATPTDPQPPPVRTQRVRRLRRSRGGQVGNFCGPVTSSSRGSVCRAFHTRGKESCLLVRFRRCTHDRSFQANQGKCGSLGPTQDTPVGIQLRVQKNKFKPKVCLERNQFLCVLRKATLSQSPAILYECGIVISVEV